MKNVLILIVLCFSITTFAQKVKLKKGEVLLDGVAILKYEKKFLGEKINLFDLKTNDELIEIYLNNNGTVTYVEDNYTQIKFLKSGDLVEIANDKSWKKWIKWLISKDVIQKDGSINYEKLPLFIKNYDENITNRTVRN